MGVIAMHSASTGLKALNTRLDVIANNLANVNTDGFKASRVNFEDLLYIERAQPGVENSNGDQRPTGLYVGLGVKASGTQQDYTQGSSIPSDNELDMMIEGRGFFQVEVEDDLGNGGMAYTRAGNFVRNSDGEIVLANSDGRRLSPGVTVPDDATNVEVLTDGRIFATLPGDPNPQEIGQLQIAVFINQTGLTQVGQNLWVESAASGAPLLGEPGTANFGTIRGGMLEGSNVDAARELIELIRTQRAFEMNSQSIRAADETLRTVSELRR